MSRLLLAAALLGASAAAMAQTVSLQGMLGSKALLIIDGGAPRALGPGESAGAVKVLSTQGDQAVVQIASQRRTLRVGEAPASVGGRGAEGNSHSDRVMLQADGRGHFITHGSINNRPVQFLVDTGASMVAMGQSEADRLGLDYKSGQRIAMNTANGVAPGWRMKVHSVRVGDVTVYDVDTVITPQPMPVVLLGNSFLNRFSMRRDADQLLLVRR